MFIKKKLAFNNVLIFEKQFKADFDKSFCVVSKMMIKDVLNIDGSIDIVKTGDLKKYELWSYIYYLYYFNNTTIEEFALMKDNDNKGKASAVKFYEVVRNTVNNQFVPHDSFIPLDVNTLSYFINILIHKYENNLTNPIVNYLQKILNRKPDMIKLGKLAITTGNSGKNVEFITNSNNAKNSNLKIKMDLKTI